MRLFRYKPREPRVPPEAPEPEAPAVQDRKFLTRMLVFVALVCWIVLRLSLRFAVTGAAAHPAWAAMMVGDALFWLALIAVVLPWLSKDNILTRDLNLKEDFLNALAIFSGAMILALVLAIACNKG